MNGRDPDIIFSSRHYHRFSQPWEIKRQYRNRYQKELRERRDEQAFLFDNDVSRCLAEVDRDQWELAIANQGGDLVAAAKECGIVGLPRGAKALWGRSADEARGTYRRWLKKRRR